MFNVVFWFCVLAIFDSHGKMLLVYLAGILSILPRLVAKKIAENFTEKREKDASFLTRIDQELSFTGFMIPLFFGFWFLIF